MWLDSRYRTYGWGEEGGTGHVLVEERQWVCQYTERYCIKMHWLPVLPELRADVRDQILLVTTCFIKEMLALQIAGTDSHDWGGRDGTWSYLPFSVACATWFP
jgi:hypothetical protein